jgi:two-component system response regulator HydG
VVSVEIPPLRERKGDVAILTRHFMEHFARAMSKPIDGISDEAMLTLESYEWPGNVRELRNVIERAAVVCKGADIGADDLSFPFRTRPVAGESLEDVEKTHIGRILERTEGNISQASQILGIDRTTLYAKIKKYGLGRS